jgi:hypothetical protein
MLYTSQESGTCRQSAACMYTCVCCSHKVRASAIFAHRTWIQSATRSSAQDRITETQKHVPPCKCSLSQLQRTQSEALARHGVLHTRISLTAVFGRFPSPGTKTRAFFFMRSSLHFAPKSKRALTTPTDSQSSFVWLLLDVQRFAAEPEGDEIAR